MVKIKSRIKKRSRNWKLDMMLLMFVIFTSSNIILIRQKSLSDSSSSEFHFLILRLAIVR
jgi:hypothetical protein